MAYGRHFLFVPGPSNVPERVLRAMDRAMVDHRSSAFPAFTREILSGLKELARTTEGQPFVFSATGTGAWEAALSNTLSPGDAVLAPRFGMFSQLWITLAERLGLEVRVIEQEWGEAASADKVEEALHHDKARAIKAVLLVHNETSTGVTSDIGAMRAALDKYDHPALLCVDGVSSIGALEFRMDDWGVDLAITGSQKGLMLPPGLGIVWASTRAVAAQAQAEIRRAYFRFDDMAASNEGGYFPYTPPLSLLYGLREVLQMLLAEGHEAIQARHARLAEGVRRAVKAWGLELCARSKGIASNTVTAVRVPDGIDAAAAIDIAFRRYDLSLGGGLGKVAGKVFRIGTMGDINELMVLGAVAGAEMALRDVGVRISPGSGVAAAMEYYRSIDPAAD